MVIRLFLYAYVFAVAFGLSAQDDTVRLEPVVIDREPFERFTIGQVSNISLASATSLEDALSSQSSIYFKSYGNQQLASISFRGTSSSQTNVLWHGIPANYPTLGQMDFSQWPAWLMGDLKLSAGSNGALFGAGAIGGSVLIDSDVRPIANHAIGRVAIGSFGQFSAGVKGGWSRGGFSGKTSLLHSFIRNDFDYEYQGVQVNQPNASVLNQGIRQQLQYRPFSNGVLFADFQFTTNDREIQPTKSAPNADDHLLTDNVRVALGYNHEYDQSSLSTTLAYLRNSQIFNETDQTVSEQYSAIASYWWQLTNYLEVRSGVNVNLYQALSDNFSGEFTDIQTDVFLSVRSSWTSQWESALSLRQSFYDANAPFLPALSNQLVLISKDRSRLTFLQSFALGYRYPTLNDRYWSPGGNPELQPESSQNLVLGMDFTKQLGQISNLELSAEVYHTWSDDWIVWVPTSEGYWAPQNFREVTIKGIELEGKLSGKMIGDYQISAQTTFNRSINESGQNAGNLLPYTPEVNYRFHYQEQLKSGFNYGVSGSYTGLRYTTLDNQENQSVAPFFLLDLTIGQEFELPIFSLNLTGAIKNLADQSYENLINRAMPGRNYQIQLTINYN